jgi:transposase
MWTEITRRKYEREGQRYASDLTDAEWALIEPHMPVAKRLGRPRETALRSVLDPILYIARTGCQWRMLLKNFPPFTTVQGYFYENLHNRGHGTTTRNKAADVARPRSRCRVTLSIAPKLSQAY